MGPCDTFPNNIPRRHNCWRPKELKKNQKKTDPVVVSNSIVLTGSTVETLFLHPRDKTYFETLRRTFTTLYR